jgi:hypothetical protein
VWKNYGFCVRIPIEPSFDKTFLFLGCYEVVYKTMLESLILQNGDLEKGQWFEILAWCHNYNTFKIIIYLFRR